MATWDLAQLESATVYDSDGDKIGGVGQVYLDDDTSEPTWVTVRTGLFGTSETFVPLQGARMEGDQDIHVAYDKATVKDAPRVDPDGHLEEDEQQHLFEYYHLGAVGEGGRTVDSDRAAERDASRAQGAVGDVDMGREDRPVADDRDRGSADSEASVTRSEERLKVGTEAVETGRARLRKYVTTEQQTVNVPVEKEVLRVERTAVDSDRPAGSIDDAGEQVEEIVLREERPVVDKETVAVEEVSISKESVTEDHTVTEDVRKEQVEVEGDDLADRGRRDEAANRDDTVNRDGRTR